MSCPLTPDALAGVLRAAGVPVDRVRRFAGPLALAMTRADIVGRARVSHFLAQLLHESAAFRYTEELASGAAYEGRRDLGNTVAGDGRRFKGRGLIQLTGRANYAAFEAHLRRTGQTGPGRIPYDLLRDPGQVARLPLAVETATWYWTTRNLNAIADRGEDRDEVVAITRRVNGGTNGLDDRLQYFMKVGAALRP